MFKTRDILTEALTGERYEMLALLGEGGQSEVYRAKKLHSDETVVLKFYHTGGSEAAKREYAIARWVHETELENSTLVPTKEIALFPYNLITLQDRNTTIPELVVTPQEFVALEFAHTGGLDLLKYHSEYLFPLLNRVTMTETGLPITTKTSFFVNVQVLKIAVLLLKALSVLHAIGIVHGDVKPANIIVTLDSSNAVEKLFLIDFGQACAPRAQKMLTDMGVSADKSECAHRKTDTGELEFAYLGTSDYVDPAAKDRFRSRKFFPVTEYFEVFKKFDLYSAAVTIWSLWYAYDVDPMTYPYSSKHMPKYTGHNPPIQPANGLERQILEELGMVSYLFEKMSGPRPNRLPASVLVPIFEYVHQIAVRELEEGSTEPKKKRAVVNSGSNYLDMKAHISTLGDGLETKTSTIPGAGLGLFATRDFADDEVITSYYGMLVPYKEAKRRNPSHIRALFPMHTAIDGRFMRDGTEITDPNLQLRGKGVAALCNDARDEERNNAIFITAHSEENQKRFLAWERGAPFRLDPEQSDVFIVADGPIKAGEEIFVSYGQRYWENQ